METIDPAILAARITAVAAIQAEVIAALASQSPNPRDFAETLASRSAKSLAPLPQEIRKDAAPFLADFFVDLLRRIDAGR